MKKGSFFVPEGGCGFANEKIQESNILTEPVEKNYGNKYQGDVGIGLAPLTKRSPAKRRQYEWGIGPNDVC